MKGSCLFRSAENDERLTMKNVALNALIRLIALEIGVAQTGDASGTAQGKSDQLAGIGL